MCPLWWCLTGSVIHNKAVYHIFPEKSNVGSELMALIRCICEKSAGIREKHDAWISQKISDGMSKGTDSCYVVCI
jgi:hypothetical protein